MIIRDAEVGDYDAVRRLHPELGVPEPPPDRDEWLRDRRGETSVVEADGAVVAYALAHAYGASGHVVEVAVAPELRRRGVGGRLLVATARRLRERGCSHWHLNVKEDNAAALALYRSLGLETAFAAQAVRVGHEVIPALPAARAVRVEVAPDPEAPELEMRFRLSRGALLRRRGVTLRADLAGRCVALARLRPRPARAAPFRLRDRRAARPLFEAMTRFVPEAREIRVVVEADVRLTELLCRLGAVEELRLLHLVGALP